MMCGKPTAGNTKEDAFQVRAYVVRYKRVTTRLQFLSSEKLEFLCF
jgi:5-methylcytosine-specific restriction endonuclease McrBC regulatory subunit McrC